MKVKYVCFLDYEGSVVSMGSGKRFIDTRSTEGAADAAVGIPSASVGDRLLTKLIFLGK